MLLRQPASFAFTTKQVWFLPDQCQVNLLRGSANIWSHLLGGVLFIELSAKFFLLVGLPDDVRFADRVAVGVYYVGAVVCLILSTIFHTFSDHSQAMHKFGNKLDHLGIILVMWGTGISGAHFAFYCQHAIRNAYFLLLTSTAVGCGVFTLRPTFRHPSYRTARFLIYCFLGSSLFTPVIHGLSHVG